jgi:site-specific recombinase XerC
MNWHSSRCPTKSASEPELKQTVIRMREKGLKARSVNSYRTAINAYLHWLNHPEIKCSPSCPHPRISKMKSEKKVLPVYSAKDIFAFVHWKPKKRCERRLQVIILMLADAGTRIS